MVIEAIERAKYIPGEQCFIALDVAASELSKDEYPSDRLIGIYEDWVGRVSDCQHRGRHRRG